MKETKRKIFFGQTRHLLGVKAPILTSVRLGTAPYITETPVSDANPLRVYPGAPTQARRLLKIKPAIRILFLLLGHEDDVCVCYQTFSVLFTPLFVIFFLGAPSQLHHAPTRRELAPSGWRARHAK